jgi:hypothetical protein
MFASCLLPSDHPCKPTTIPRAQGRSNRKASQQWHVDFPAAFAVASRAMLLLAGTRAFHVAGVEQNLPPPKWRDGVAKQRITTEELVQELRGELWSQA